MLLFLLTGNFFVSGSGRIQYFNCEPGYIYHVTYSLNESVPVVLSNDTPAVNVTFERLTTLTQENSSYSFIADTNTICIISYRASSYVSVTREKIENMNGAISDLVENVGINSFWNVFENGVDFIGVVVLVGFGIFLVVLAIRKVQKGKSDY